MTQQDISDGVNLPEQQGNQGPEVAVNSGTAEEGQLTSEEQKVSWLELFFDLIFVTAFDQLAKRLGDALTPENIVVFLLMFTAMWSVWLGNTQFAARYGNGHRIYRWGTVAELLAIVALSLTLRSDVEHTGWLFASAYAITRLILMTMYLLVARSEPAVAQHARTMALGVGASAALWLLSAPTSHTLTLVIWGVALALTLLAPFRAQQLHHHALPHHEHLPERVGLLQIIALGGIVTEAVAGGRQQEMTVLGQAPTFLALIICIGVFRLYFDQARALPVMLSNLRSQGSDLLLWIYAHLPLTVAIMMLGVGLGHGIASEDQHSDQLNLSLVSWSLTAVFLSLALIRLHTVRQVGVSRLSRTMLALLLGAGVSGALALSGLGTLSLHLASAALVALVAYAVARDPASARLDHVEEKLLEKYTDDA